MEPVQPVRPASVLLHRWVGLLLGGWFALVGLSGALLVWHAELDARLNPAWFAEPSPCAPGPRPVARVLQVLAATAPGEAIVQVAAPARPGTAYVAWTGRNADGRRTQHFVDAACGRSLGQREWGALRWDRAHLVPMLYELHRALLAGERGHRLVGLAGLVFLGLVLAGLLAALPRRWSRAAWTRVLTVKRDAGLRRRWYDLHRATGAWLAAFLALMAVTGAYLCFPDQGRALVGAMLPTLPTAAPALATAPPSSVSLGPDALVAAAERRFPGARWSRIQLGVSGTTDAEVRLLQPGEARMDTGDTRVRLDGSGQLGPVRDPLAGPAGDRLLAWLFPLHSGEALGQPGRWAWTLFGGAPALLLATGGWLWWQRRRARCPDVPREARTAQDA